MISEETYLEMKEHVAKYETAQPINCVEQPINCVEQPYLTIVTVTVETEKKYNPEFGDDKVCKCGHSYERHFDSYDQMNAVGCKYCACFDFEEII